MRRSDAHEYRRAYNAQAVVCAEGSQLIVEHGIVTTTADSPSFAATTTPIRQPARSGLKEVARLESASAT